MRTNRTGKALWHPYLEILEDRLNPGGPPSFLFRVSGDELEFRSAEQQGVKPPPLSMTDNGHGTIQVVVGDEQALTFTGIDSIRGRTGDGDDVVTYRFGGSGTASDPDEHPADFSITMGDGHNTLALSGVIGLQDRPPAHAWDVDVKTGDGVNQLIIFINGPAPINLTANLGAGTNSLIYEQDEVEQMSLPSTVIVHGGSGVNDIMVTYGFLPAVQSMPQSPITVLVDGAGTNHLVNCWNWWTQSSNPAAFYIPVRTLFHGDGYDTAEVEYYFRNAPGTENGIIAIHAPITVNGSGTGIRQVQVDFAPLDDSHPAMVQIDAALTFDIHGGDHGALIGLLYGNPDLMSNPELMPGGSLDVRLVGGARDDTITCIIALAPGSMGQVTAKVRGGLGTNDLTLEVFCPNDNDVTAEIFLGPNDTFHATDNVLVRR
jgi:hypothetical protein